MMRLTNNWPGACASLLSNPDEEAIAAISALGFGGIYVVPETGDSLNDMPYEQLKEYRRIERHPVRSPRIAAATITDAA